MLGPDDPMYPEYSRVRCSGIIRWVPKTHVQPAHAAAGHQVSIVPAQKVAVESVSGDKVTCRTAAGQRVVLPSMHLKLVNRKAPQVGEQLQAYLYN